MRFRSLTPPLATALLLLAGCASVQDARRPEAPRGRMVQAPSVAGVAQESLGQPPWNRRGEFLLSGQRVRYERGAERLALFEPLAGEMKAALRFSWAGPAGDSSSVCESWTPQQSNHGRAVGAKPWVLSCRWGSAPAAMLQIGEGQLRGGVLTREGAYRRGDLTVGLRSVHQLDGRSAPQPAAVGYEMLHQGTVVGSLDLSGAAPQLRRPDPATPVGRAVTEAAIALALVWER
jgi:hypothetical protein